MRCSLTVALLLLVTACTSYRIDRGEQLIANGKVEEGLTELERVARENPDSATARGAYLTQRAAYTMRLVADGDNARIWGMYDEAERLYQQALRLDPANPSARNGLDVLLKHRTYARLVAEGEEQLKAGNLAGAETKARSVLADESAHRGARALMRAVNERRATSDAEAPQLRAGLQRPVTLEFRDANLRSIFEVISQTSGINFVFDRDVRTDLRTSIFVRNTNLDDVIKFLLLTNQLDRKILNENSILVFPNTAAKQKDYQELVVRTFYLANADPKQTAQLIKTVAKTRDLYVDDKLNLLVVRETPEAMKLVEKLVATQDLGEPEVLLEVEVLEVSRSRLNELGVNPADQLLYGVGLGGTAVVGGSTGSSGTTISGATTVSPIVALTGGGFRWFVPNPAAVVRLRGTEGTTNVLANPRIRVKNREKAKIHIGEKVPVITTTSTANVGVSSSVSYLDTGLKLDVEPNIHLENEVAMKVQLEVSNIIEQLNINNTIAYRLGTRNTSTTLRLKDGETQMLAGLISDDDRRTVDGLPYLSSVPLLNRLFANTDTRAKTEIVLMITPRIVRNVLRPETVPAQFFSGTESNVGAPPMQLRAASTRQVAMPAGSTVGNVAAPSSTGAAIPVPSAPRPHEHGSALLWIAPTQVLVGQEFSVNLALAPGGTARSARVDLVFDPKVLQRVGAPAGESDRTTVELRGTQGAAPASPTEVRFRVISQTPTSSVISIENVQGMDATGAPISLASPPGHALSIVLGQGAR